MFTDVDLKITMRLADERDQGVGRRKSVQKYTLP